jgi:hypothetical protein
VDNYYEKKFRHIIVHILKKVCLLIPYNYITTTHSYTVAWGSPHSTFEVTKLWPCGEHLSHWTTRQHFNVRWSIVLFSIFCLNLVGNPNFNDLTFLSQISNEANENMILKILPRSITNVNKPFWRKVFWKSTTFQNQT